jgi:hypothetical protein
MRGINEMLAESTGLWIAGKGLLLMVRHFAEHAPSILVLTFFYFNVLVMECRLLCSLARVFNRNEHGNAPFS